ncbi:MAG: hypothetical protein IJU05_06545 [Schwartzia sp.]|nr:hypothetical protein [Schwartzia sp. (in: firmicutes)]
MRMLTAVAGLAGIIILLAAGIAFFFKLEGDGSIVVRSEQRTPFEMEDETETSVVLSSRIVFANPGKQYATIMDCFVRPQLPFEQYDGIDARAKAEVEGQPREDDYFEATLVGKREELPLLIKVKLTARKGMDIRTALARMVDLPLDIVFTELGRHPWKLKKLRIVLTAEEMAKATGVTLVED